MALLAVLGLPPPRAGPRSTGSGTPGAEAEPSPRSGGPAAARARAASATRGPAAAGAGRSAAGPTLEQAPDAWHRTQREIASGIAELKNAIRRAFDDEEEEELIAEIDRNLGKLDSVLDHLDDRLANALKRAHSAADPAARASELRNAKTILSNYISYVSSDPLIAGIDANPFGVQINLRQRLTDTLRQMARAIGR